jgi:hypothetical protein
MTGWPNPSITGKAIVDALGPDGPTGKSEQQAALDEADLRELERAAYYGETPAISEAVTTVGKPRRTILDRLFRRRV